jgi:putative transposase
MPRTASAARGGICYHVTNRGNARSQVFHSADDGAAFVALFAKACERHEMRVLACCLMPDHFHYCLWPREDRDMARLLHWLLTSQVAKHRKRHKTTGHIWQGRFKAFPAQSDGHLFTVMRSG